MSVIFIQNKNGKSWAAKDQKSGDVIGFITETEWKSQQDTIHKAYYLSYYDIFFKIRNDAADDISSAQKIIIEAYKNK